MLKILDCTLRDGGYYTNWDFDKELVNSYIRSIDVLPINYIEVGYRNVPSSEYIGKYAYSPVYELQNLRKQTNKKLVIMINEKSTSLIDLKFLLSPISGVVDMIRIAVDPLNLKNAIKLAEETKKMGFEVGINVMYMSKWNEYSDFTEHLKEMNGVVDLFCMVDSFGGINPQEIENTIKLVKKHTSVPIGFHGHNNLELSLINSITAIKMGVEFIDSTILGMGRGAGNLKTELLLTYLSKMGIIDLDFNILGDIVSLFNDLHKKYNWGTNLPYMISGTNSLPQKDVMDWVTNRVYSFNSIIRALDNKKSNIVDNNKFPIFEENKFENVIIIGGGNTAINHFDGIKEFIGKNENTAIIHATSKNAIPYQQLSNTNYFCLVGSEGRRLSNIFSKEKKFNGICILPPFPRKMGTDVPSFVNDFTYELDSIDFTGSFTDSCTSIALQLAINLNAKSIYLVGYDGYSDGVITAKESDLYKENELIFELFLKHTKQKLISLTPTVYKNLQTKSVYQNQ